MKTERLIEIIFVLLNKKQTTATTLAQRFNVSKRTIYRDIDILSLAKVPVFASRGRSGGISLLEEYTIDKFFLTKKEQEDIVFALQNLEAVGLREIGSTLNKVEQVFKSRAKTNWIEVDFSYWGSEKDEKEKFDLLKESILSKQTIALEYINSCGEKTKRTVEPLKLVFKGHSWYVIAFCRQKQEYRIFKVSRMIKLSLQDEFFNKSVPEEFSIDKGQTPANLVCLKLKVSKQIAYRVYDEFKNSMISSQDENFFNIIVKHPYDEWLVGYLLSFGSFIEVLEPNFVRETIAQQAKEISLKYK